MTVAAAEPAPVETVQPIAELFRGSVSALWATTYNVDLQLFNEFLLGRLGDPPLNVVILSDHRRLAAALARIAPEQVDALHAVNSRWLLRAVRPGGQAFHPKSYLVVHGRRATLLVGSGNLSRGGLDEGHEVFTTFVSATAVGDAAIAIWCTWIRRLVELIGDTALAARFRDLEARLPEPPTPSAVADLPLLHNLDVAIADQLAERVRADTDQVEELHVTAPFYDGEVDALGRLIELLAPQRLRVYLGGATSVDGSCLRDCLDSSGADVSVASYEPQEFVHAKLVGVITRRNAWLLSGSANLSRAALARSTAEHGNVELAVLAPLTAQAVRAAFIPSGLTVIEKGLDMLRNLSLRTEPESSLPSVRLCSAVALERGLVSVLSDPPPLEGWLLDDLTDRQPLTVQAGGLAVTAGPLAGRLVQLLDADGGVVSNRVVVDDPRALEAALRAPGAGRPAKERPSELHGGDLSRPIGRALQFIHENFVMDVSERANSAGSGASVATEDAESGDDSLWDRLQREELARDPRAHIYGRIGRRYVHTGFSDPIVDLLEKLRGRLPVGPGSPIRQLLDRPASPHPPSPDDEQSGRRWAPATHIRVRARNVLRRWAAAQTDPRLLWVNPLAPAKNFAMITWTLAALRFERAVDPGQVELTPGDIDGLWEAWLGPFAGTGQGDGWLDRLDEPTRHEVLDDLPGWVPVLAAALCWLVVRRGHHHRERVVRFQASLNAALAHGLVGSDVTTAEYLSAVCGHKVTLAEVDTQLLEAADFIDDDLWCERTAAELGLTSLSLEAPPGATAIDVRLDVEGVTDPLLDTRVPRLVTETRTYRRCQGVSLFAAEGWRMSFASGDTVVYRLAVEDSVIESDLPVTVESLAELAGEGGVLAGLFPSVEQVA